MPTYPSAPNALDIPEPQDRPPNSLAADAWDANRKAYADWLARDRAEQVRLGNIDPVTGQFTPQGWQAQAQTIGGGFGPADVGLAGGALGLIKNYHGSPHLFPPTAKNPLGEFDMSKIGTGEGNQSFGQGMYTGDAESLARGYRDRLTPKIPDYTIGGESVLTVLNRDWGKHPPGASMVLERLNRGDPPSFIESQLKRDAPYDPIYKQGYDWLVANKDRIKEVPPSPGHMYEVNIHAEPGDYLHWDKPLSEQSPQVQAALTPEALGLTLKGPFGDKGYYGYVDKTGRLVGTANAGAPPEGLFYPTEKGHEIYKLLHSDPAAAAAMLRDAGIPGIRYLDRSSRGGDPDAPGATYNHATWDTDKMEIIRRYGIAGLMVGGGAAAANALGPQEPNQ